MTGQSGSFDACPLSCYTFNRQVHPRFRGENRASMTVIDFRHTAPTRAASSLWQAHGYLPVPICRHSPSQGQTGAVFPLSGLRPAGRAESGSGLPPGSPVIRRRRVRQSRTGALLALPCLKELLTASALLVSLPLVLCAFHKNLQNLPIQVTHQWGSWLPYGR